MFDVGVIFLNCGFKALRVHESHRALVFTAVLSTAHFRREVSARFLIIYLWTSSLHHSVFQSFVKPSTVSESLLKLKGHRSSTSFLSLWVSAAAERLTLVARSFSSSRQLSEISAVERQRCLMKKQKQEEEKGQENKQWWCTGASGYFSSE